MICAEDQLFQPSNQLTFDTVKQDGQRLQKLLTLSKTSVIRMDLSQVSLCDSAGLALLIEVKRLCQRGEKILIIEGMPKVISALAEFCGVDALLAQ
ncbi:MAG: STAS domain-containing protein [Legionellales bacterium]|nr:STAS domain-containing protein [Legionellales bacterium]